MKAMAKNNNKKDKKSHAKLRDEVAMATDAIDIKDREYLESIREYDEALANEMEAEDIKKLANRLYQKAEAYRNKVFGEIAMITQNEPYLGYVKLYVEHPPSENWDSSKMFNRLAYLVNTGKIFELQYVEEKLGMSNAEMQNRINGAEYVEIINDIVDKTSAGIDLEARVLETAKFDKIGAYGENIPALFEDFIEEHGYLMTEEQKELPEDLVLFIHHTNAISEIAQAGLSGIIMAMWHFSSNFEKDVARAKDLKVQIAAHTLTHEDWNAKNGVLETQNHKLEADVAKNLKTLEDLADRIKADTKQLDDKIRMIESVRTEYNELNARVEGHRELLNGLIKQEAAIEKRLSADALETEEIKRRAASAKKDAEDAEERIRKMNDSKPVPMQSSQPAENKIDMVALVAKRPVAITCWKCGTTRKYFQKADKTTCSASDCRATIKISEFVLKRGRYAPTTPTT